MLCCRSRIFSSEGLHACRLVGIFEQYAASLMEWMMQIGEIPKESINIFFHSVKVSLDMAKEQMSIAHEKEALQEPVVTAGDAGIFDGESTDNHDGSTSTASKVRAVCTFDHDCSQSNGDIWSCAAFLHNVLGRVEESRKAHHDLLHRLCSDSFAKALGWFSFGSIRCAQGTCSHIVRVYGRE